MSKARVRKTLDRLAYASLVLDVCIAVITLLTYFDLGNPKPLLIPIDYLLTLVVIPLRRHVCLVALAAGKGETVRRQRREGSGFLTRARVGRRFTSGEVVIGLIILTKAYIKNMRDRSHEAEDKIRSGSGITIAIISCLFRPPAVPISVQYRCFGTASECSQLSYSTFASVTYAFFHAGAVYVKDNSDGRFSQYCWMEGNPVNPPINDGAMCNTLLQ